MNQYKKLAEGRRTQTSNRLLEREQQQMRISKGLIPIKEDEKSEEKPQKIKLPKKLKIELERGRLFAQSPRLVHMDKLIRKNKGLKIDEKIYTPEYFTNIQKKVKEKETEYTKRLHSVASSVFQG